MKYRIGENPALRAGRNLESWQLLKKNLATTGSANFDQLVRWCTNHDHSAGGKGFVNYCIKHEWLVPTDLVRSFTPIDSAKKIDFSEPDSHIQSAANDDSGIYVALLLTDRLMPVTRDPRYVDTCAKVNNKNVKIGKANSFMLREKNYWLDFDAENVEFIPIAKLADIQGAETVILRQLDSFRLISPKGGKMDWLVGIEPDAVVKAAYDVLVKGSFDYEVVLNRFHKGDMPH